MIAHILGLGQSLIYHEPDGNFTIGVNDIFRYRKTHCIVFVDLPRVFTPERLKVIIESKPLQFITLFPEWKNYFGDKTLIIKKAPGSGDMKLLRSENYVCSNNSTFVATVHAFKCGYSKIILHGVDLKNHHALSRERTFKKAMAHFKELSAEFKKYGVTLYVGNAYSALSEFLPVYRTGSAPA